MGLLVGRATGVMDMVLAAAKSSPSHDPDILDALIALEAQGHHVAVPLIRKALGMSAASPPAAGIGSRDEDHLPGHRAGLGQSQCRGSLGQRELRGDLRY